MSQLPPRRKDDDRRARRVEAVIALISGGLVLAVLGVLLLQAVRPGSGLPELSVREDINAVAPPGQMRFLVVNQGERAAASVTVALTLRDAGAIDKRTVLIDFVPSHSQVSGAFLLAERDRGQAAEMSVESYLDP